MKKTITAGVLAATIISSIAPAMARPPRHAPAHGWRSHNGDIQYRRTDNGIRYWRGEDGRYYCKRGDGTVGLLAGAALGALIGREIDTRGERVTGTVLGAAAGALIGNELAKGRTRCR